MTSAERGKSSNEYMNNGEVKNDDKVVVDTAVVETEPVKSADKQDQFTVINPKIAAQRILRSQELLYTAPTDTEDNGTETDDNTAPHSDGGAPWTVAGRKRKFKKDKFSPAASTSGGQQSDKQFKGPSPLRKSQRKGSGINSVQPNDKENNKMSDCCGKIMEGALWISCTKCFNWFHIDCVHLTGLSKEHVRLLKNWLCFQCMRTKNTNLSVNPGKLDHTTGSICQEIRMIVREELTAVKDDLVTVTKDVQSNVKKDVKIYADVLKSGQKEVLQAATAPAMVKDVCQSINVENLERERRKRNVTVSKVPEAPVALSGEQRRAHDMEYICSDKLKMKRNEIATCFRAGRVRKDEVGGLIPRPLVVVFKTVETTNFWHNDGKGFNDGIHWVNEDLCKGDRDARFFVRQERRKRQQQQQQERKM